MGRNTNLDSAESLLQLVLRAHRVKPVESAEDWRELGQCAARMLFWCGGAIYGCRCEGNEIRFALQVRHASMGTIAHHVSGAYSRYLRRTRNLSGSIFKHYIMIPLEAETSLADLVFWLHRTSNGDDDEIANLKALEPIWTTESAYLVPNSLPWIDTTRVLNTISAGSPAIDSYRRRTSATLPAHVAETFTSKPTLRQSLRGPRTSPHAARNPRPSIETIARAVAALSNVSYQDMLTKTRRRGVTKARAIATVLATRNHATAADAARLFNRSRSTLIEQVEYYRKTQPEIFIAAESLLETFLSESQNKWTHRGD